MSESVPLLELDDATIQYETGAGMVTAVSDASFRIDGGEYFGLVGESGCGKSTIAKSILGGLDDNGQVTSGEIRYKGDPIQDYTEEEFNQYVRWGEISYIPQGSMNSLDPLQRIDEQAWAIANTHTDMSREEAMDRFREMFEIVGLQVSRISDYPHQFSGGMEQRAIIALALFLEPSLIIADEPTTALDVIMQDQIFKYLDVVKEETDTSMMLITHDISLVFESCERMAIMHSGQVAETGNTVSLYDHPHHPYSILLQEAFPDVRYPDRELGIIDGYPPQTIGEVDFCTFVDRCPWAIDECGQHTPPLEQIEDTEGDHMASCFRKEEVPELYAEDERFRGDVTGQGFEGDVTSDD